MRGSGTGRSDTARRSRPSAEPNPKPQYDIVACYAESVDGIHWIKPKLGVIDWQGSKENNIVFDKALNTSAIDNFMVFRDDNPACPPDMRYKGIGVSKGGLRCFPSPDGINFRLGDVITNKGAFDSLNVVFWDEP